MLRPPRQLGLDALAAAGCAVLAMLATGYRFAVDDQVQYLAWANALRDPAGLAGDPYIEAFESLRSVVWHPIAWLVPTSILPLALATLTLLSGWMAALLCMRLARALGGSTPAAMLAALLLVVPKEHNWFGLVALVDSEFTATMLGVPLSLAAMLAMASARPVVALAIAGLTVPVHAQTGAALLTACTLWLALFGQSQHRALASGLALVGGAGLLLYRAGREVPPATLAQVESLGRDLYAPLIDVTAAPLTAWGVLLAILLIGACAAFMLRSPAATRLKGFAAVSLVMPAGAALVLALGLNDPVLWTLMPGRWFMLAQLAALVLLAVAAQSRGGALLLAALALVLWPTGLGRSIDGGLLLLAVALVAVGVVRRPTGQSRPDQCHPRRPLLVWIAGGLIGLRIGWGTSHLRYEPAEPGVGVGRQVADGVLQTHRDWRAVQRWARAATPPGTRFVTPPTIAGWRVFSDRPTAGELRDGGILFYGTAEGLLAWRDRMAALGQSDRLGLAWTNDWDLSAPPTTGSARAIYAERAGDPAVLDALEAAFVVLEAHGPAPAFGPVAYENATFRVIALPAP